MENNKLALVVANYLSRFDRNGLESLGYKSFREAFKDIAVKLNVNQNSVKNMRDEFDPYYDNGRVGWYQRDSRPSRKAVMDKYDSYSEEELREEVEAILRNEPSDDVMAFSDIVIKDDTGLLRDLNNLCNEARERFSKEYTPEEVRLSEEFKNTYGAFMRDQGSYVVEFSESTVIITTGGNLKIYAPNQWFVIASYMVKVVQELFIYKRYLIEMLNEKFPSTGEKNEFIKAAAKEVTDKTIDILSEASSEFFIGLGLEGPEVNKNTEYIIKFTTDYGWWFGSKTIDRGDFFMSPVLSLLYLRHDSQSYVAEIIQQLALHPELEVLTDELIDEHSLAKSTARPTGEKIRDRLPGGVNLIVYGAPGTGKSRWLEDHFSKSHVRPHRVVFHPEYNYYDFIGAYKPVPVYRETEDVFRCSRGEVCDKGEAHIDYRFVPGPFIDVFVKAWLDPGNMYTLLIEEINRANAAAVFGEIFQLLDRWEDGNSEFSYKPSKELEDYLLGIDGMEQHIRYGLRLPSNMNIVATMNSADQGVNIIDSAFKRRWSVIYMGIDIDNAIHRSVDIQYAGTEVKWGAFVSAINDKLINLGIDEDKHIGPYFIKPNELSKGIAVDKLLLYLWDDVLRHRRSDFFVQDLRGFPDLSEKFNKSDVMGINDFIDKYSGKYNESTTDDTEGDMEDVTEISLPDEGGFTDS